MLKLKFIVFFSLFFLVSCQQSPTCDKYSNYFKPKESGIQNGNIKIIPIQTKNRTLKVWTKTIGNNPTCRVLLLSGGPGCSHEYFECFESFLPKESIEFIYYDQIGTGNSDDPKDTSFWDLSRYVEELEQVRVALRLDSTNFYLLGHSWGGILAMEYSCKYQSKMKALIISNMMASCPKYGEYANNILSKKLDPQILDTIRKIESNKDFDNPKYMELLMPNFYNKFICRIPLEAWPEPMRRSFDHVNSSLYVTMQGPSEFGIGGNLVNWDRSANLKDFNLPCLVIAATNDTMDPAYMEWMSKQIKRSRFLLCLNGSHMCMWDDQEKYFTGLLKFIQEVESKNL